MFERDSEKYKLVIHMLECLETPDRELTKWEEDFIESVRDQFETRDYLSNAQIEIIERIYAEKTA